MKKINYYIIGKKGKNNVKIVYPLGVKGFKRLIESEGHAVDVILENVKRKLKRKYHITDYMFYRYIYENAVDVELAVKLKLIALLVKKFHKVPKQLIFYVPIKKYVD